MFDKVIILSYIILYFVKTKQSTLVSLDFCIMWEGPVRKATRVQSQRKINQRTILTFTNTIKKIMRENQ